MRRKSARRRAAALALLPLLLKWSACFATPLSPRPPCEVESWKAWKPAAKVWTPEPTVLRASWRVDAKVIAIGSSQAPIRSPPLALCVLLWSLWSFGTYTLLAALLRSCTRRQFGNAELQLRLI
ncbi:unnamed protein product [Effrenium voratum]|uniref:Secreted protein n=1 Tax=Effrenium voratum TaxID=2562239 RepID=A0AA36NER5_9DINO|nr:unnamed protein product [Effrenium voratum]|mmetsp:Transcript_13285/g.31517  ORF Transcript_13285/g.31517 Transcript_13285/m.31517 type:complete len:124 (-) Transcript_13285:69-440(-)